MRMVDALERAELHWCAIGGIAVNHWAAEPMVTRDGDFVVAVDEVDRAVAALPPGRRVVVIVEYRIRGLSRAERAERIGVKPGAYAERLLQAKISLKNALLV